MPMQLKSLFSSLQLDKIGNMFSAEIQIQKWFFVQSSDVSVNVLCRYDPDIGQQADMFFSDGNTHLSDFGMQGDDMLQMDLG